MSGRFRARLASFDTEYGAFIGTTVLLVVAMFYIASTLSAVADFAWRTPMFDQFRLYAHYLTLPFPQNVLQLENGHRPVVPALLRVFEIWCCGASQSLQIWSGAALATTAVGVLVSLVWRTRAVRPVIRAASALALVMCVFWLANARMLLHGNESLHAYLVVVSVLMAMWAACAASRRHAVGWMLAATLGCLLAMFSFGPGVAAFPALMLVGFLSGVRPRLLAIPVAGLLAGLVVYLFALPGDEGVRAQLQPHPVENIVTATRWIASPWVHAWLGAADGTVIEWLPRGVRHTGAHGRLLADSAGAVVGDGGLGTINRLAAAFGIVGAIAWALLGVRLWRRKLEATTVERVLFGAAGFALGVALLVSVARQPLFAALPAQVFADRYLVWPSIFWGALLAMCLFALPRSRASSIGAFAALSMVAVMLHPTQRAWAGWAAATHRIAERSIVAAWMDLRGPVFPGEPDASRMQVETTLRMMERDRLGPFAEPPAALPGESIVVDDAPVDCTPARLQLEESMTGPAGSPVLAVEGWCAAPEVADRNWILIVDGASRVRGLARWSWRHDASPGFPARKQGYDGFVIGDPGSSYRIVVAQANGRFVAIANDG